MIENFTNHCWSVSTVDEIERHKWYSRLLCITTKYLLHRKQQEIGNVLHIPLGQC